MAITDAKKIDYLFKKLGFGVTKTDTNSQKAATAESIASPLLLRADKVLTQASSIPAVQPASSAGVVTVYPTSAPQETTSDITATTSRTWKTGLTDWVPPEIGSTYQVKVYIHTSGDASNAAGSGTQVFAAGSGNNDEWFFDYQSGVLHFIGTNLPNGVSFSGKSVYIAGARYTGTFGVGGSGSMSSIVEDTTPQLGGALDVNGKKITSVSNGDIDIEPNGSGDVLLGNFKFDVDQTVGSGQDNFVLTYDNSTGKISLETAGSTSVTAQAFAGDNSTVAFTLSSASTTAGTLVMLNGIVQIPTTAYAVSGTTLTMTEAPATGDALDVRIL